MSLPLILLPGMMCDERVFALQINALPGNVHVEVAACCNHDSIFAMAADLLTKAPARFVLGGLSMGGIVAMEVLRQAPTRVAALALMDTNPLAETDAVKARRAPQMEKARAGQLAAVMRDEMKPNYINNSPQRAEILDLCLDMALKLGADVFCRQSAALRDRTDQTAILAGFKGPSLILCGRDDVLCPLTRHTLMHNLMPHARFSIIENAGHLPVLEQPAPTNAALARWLKEIPHG